MRKLFLLILVFVCSVAFGQGEIVKKGQKALTKNAKILKAHYLWEYNEPSDWANIHYAKSGEALLLVNDSADRYIAFNCTVQSSGQYCVDVYGGTKADSLIYTTTLNNTIDFNYQMPQGKGKSYGSNGYDTYIIRIYPKLKTKNITLFYARNHPSSSMTNVGTLLANINIPTLTTFTINIASLQYCNFYKCINITTINGVFRYAPRLVTVTFPKKMKSLQYLGHANSSYSPFNNCPNLKRITLPDSLPNVLSMYQCFTNCTSLEYVKMPIYAPKISDFFQTFSGCTKLKTVQLPIYTPLLTSMASCFSNCSTLVSVRLPEITNLKKNIEGIFARCVKLETVNLGGITQVNNLGGVFSICPSLKTVIFPKMPLLTGTGSHNAIETALGTFYGSTGLRKLVLPDSVPHLKSVYTNFFYQTSIDTLIFFKKADSLVTFPSILTTLVSVDTFSTCVWGNQMVTFNITIKDLKYFIQPTLKVNQLILRGASLATASSLHTIDIDWANSTYGGTSPQIDIRWNSLSATTIDAIFTALPVVVGKTIDVSGNPGSATCTPTIATAKGWTVII